MMSKLESFIYTCLPALLILIFSEVSVYLANGNITLTMIILGIFYVILVWWLFQYTRIKVDEQVDEVQQDEDTESTIEED